MAGARERAGFMLAPVSGPPIPADQLCGSFASGRTTSDWQMTISASGNYSLVCHFPAV